LDSPSPPPAPDPVRTAEAQTASNRETAITNATLNRINQYSPWGSTTYNITGYDENGVPRYEQNSSLSPQTQGLFDSYMNMSQGLGGMGNAQLGQLREQYSTPFNLEEGLGRQQFDMQRQLLDPVWDRNRASAENRLIQRGFNIGSEGYTRGMGDVADNQNRAYLQAMLGSRDQAMREALTNRSTPLNEFNAMRTGTQVGMPQQAAVPGVNQANTDVAGITMAAHNANMANYNAQNANNNAMMSGLFGMGSAAMPFLLSDRRTKRDIEQIGFGSRGLPLYSFRYKWDDAIHIGYMADEVEAVAPWAVHELPGGYLMIDYSEV
jgi:hypothetical protein